ncbi:futalosine hydrolase [Kitasatospora sp. NBC_01250]|uniref:futalosine hydrolase n=1 Tax=unclassified Kitasatospora TaxID=2633591 RepID=UPI002E140A81|nr:MULTISPECIES: futalosine hydrolase [unclassified Kitasatospora]WSJ68693.1 futalosine hydrolase [Kitasatospora sp. NBC_01302]
MTLPQRADEQPSPPGGARLLVVVAVAAEAEAVLRGAGADRVTVVTAGVGPAAAAGATALALATGRHPLVVSAGIAGGFAPHAPIGSVVAADAIVAADLGAQTPDGFQDVAELGFGTVRHTPSPAALALLAGATGAVVGPVLTVSTVTGSAERAAELTGRHPGAVAEAMEGFGVAEAAVRCGVPVLELRTVSNAVGPRDRAAWRIGEALGALERAFAALPYDRLTALHPLD